MNRKKNKQIDFQRITYTHIFIGPIWHCVRLKGAGLNVSPKVATATRYFYFMQAVTDDIFRRDAEFLRRRRSYAMNTSNI